MCRARNTTGPRMHCKFILFFAKYIYTYIHICIYNIKVLYVYIVHSFLSLYVQISIKMKKLWLYSRKYLNDTHINDFHYTYICKLTFFSITEVTQPTHTMVSEILSTINWFRLSMPIVTYIQKEGVFLVQPPLRNPFIQFFYIHHRYTYVFQYKAILKFIKI